MLCSLGMFVIVSAVASPPLHCRLLSFESCLSGHLYTHWHTDRRRCYASCVGHTLALCPNSCTYYQNFSTTSTLSAIRAVCACLSTVPVSLCFCRPLNTSHVPTLTWKFSPQLLYSVSFKQI